MARIYGGFLLSFFCFFFFSNFRLESLYGTFVNIGFISRAKYDYFQNGISHGKISFSRFIKLFIINEQGNFITKVGEALFEKTYREFRGSRRINSEYYLPTNLFRGRNPLNLV